MTRPVFMPHPTVPRRQSSAPRGAGLPLGPWAYRPGTIVPRTDNFDVATWQQPYSLRLYAFEGWFQGWAFPLMLALNFLLYGGDGFAFAADDSRAAQLEELTRLSALVLGPLLALTAIHWILWHRRGGWITIDAQARTLAWVRPGDRDAPTRTWSFDDIREVGQPGLGLSVLRLDMGDRKLKIRVPSKATAELPRTLQAVLER